MDSKVCSISCLNYAQVNRKASLAIFLSSASLLAVPIALPISYTNCFRNSTHPSPTKDAVNSSVDNPCCLPSVMPPRNSSSARFRRQDPWASVPGLFPSDFCAPIPLDK